MAKMTVMLPDGCLSPAELLWQPGDLQLPGSRGRAEGGRRGRAATAPAGFPRVGERDARQPCPGYPRLPRCRRLVLKEVKGWREVC